MAGKRAAPGGGLSSVSLAGVEPWRGSCRRRAVHTSRLRPTSLLATPGRSAEADLRLLPANRPGRGAGRWGGRGWRPPSRTAAPACGAVKRLGRAGPASTPPSIGRAGCGCRSEPRYSSPPERASRDLCQRRTVWAPTPTPTRTLIPWRIAEMSLVRRSLHFEGGIRWPSFPPLMGLWVLLLVGDHIDRGPESDRS